MNIGHNCQALYTQQELCIKNFSSSRLINIFSTNEIEKERVREKILDCIQVFSNYFQKIVMLRSTFTNSVTFSMMTRTHLNEEFGHDDILLNERKNKNILFDPVLDSAMAWFCWKMLGLNDLEKTILMHWVLESSAYCFFTHAKEIFDRYRQMEYFKIHTQADEEHKDIDPLFLENLRPDEYTNLTTVLSQGWAIMTVACDRIVELVNQS